MPARKELSDKEKQRERDRSARQSVAKKAAHDRVKAAKSANALPVFKYMEERKGIGTVAVKCKCGAVIQELRPVPELSETERINGRTIIRERVALIANSSYTEVEILFEDGSKHITPSCKVCARRGYTKQQLEDIYSADMDQWNEEESRGGGRVNWELNGDRVVKSSREITPEERFRD